MRSRIIGVLVPSPAEARHPGRAARDVIAALEARGHTARAIPADRDLAGRLRRERVELAFLGLEGRAGGDGAVQAALDAAGVPYTGPTASGAALAANRAAARDVLRRCGLPTPPSYLVPAGLAAERVGELHGDLGYPVVARSPRRASPVVAASAIDPGALAAACANAGEELLVERVPRGPRVRIALLDGRPLGAELVPAAAARPEPSPRGLATESGGPAQHGRAARRAGAARVVKAASPRPTPRGLPERRPLAARAAEPPPAAAVRARRPLPAAVVGARRLEGILRQASAAARALGLAGPALVEIALDPDANEVVLDVDPSPGLARGAPMARIARASGLRFEDLIAAIAAGAAQIDQPLAA